MLMISDDVALGISGTMFEYMTKLYDMYVELGVPHPFLVLGLQPAQVRGAPRESFHF